MEYFLQAICKALVLALIYLIFFQSFLESWIGRGLFLILYSCVTITLDIPIRKDIMTDLRVIISLLLGFQGVLYFLMGALCLR